MACGDPIDDPPGDAPHFEVWAHNTSVQVYHTPGPPREGTCKFAHVHVHIGSVGCAYT